MDPVPERSRVRSTLNHVQGMSQNGVEDFGDVDTSWRKIKGRSVARSGTRSVANEILYVL